ncbi:MAG: hypothetical protein ABIJ47_10820 [Candidatus Bathyarchaeota archaeon]
MSEEYDLKRSREKVGQLYPVIKANWGDNPIIDGYHRKNADPEWREVVLEDIDSKEKFLKARIIANLHRRTVPASEIKAWVNELAEYARNEKGIQPGEISGWIAEETGYAERTIRRYLDEKFKEPRGFAIQGQPTATETVEPTAVELDAADRLSPEAIEKLRPEIADETIQHTTATYDAPEAAESIPHQMDDESEEAGEAVTRAELEQVGREIGEQMREAFSRLDVRPNHRWERFALKGRLLMIIHQLENHTLYHPTDPQATLVWSNGDTVQKALELLEGLP